MASNTTTKTGKAPKYACGLCGRLDIAERMVFSTHTGARYCGTDFNGCRARAARKRKAAS